MCIHSSQSRIAAVLFSGSPLQSLQLQYITVFSTSWFMENKNVSSRDNKNKYKFPHSLFKCSVWANIFKNIFLVSVCSCIRYPGLHQSSSKANSQGQASGRSLNRGYTSIMAPASAELTLPQAQEKEDSKSQEQAAKAERFLFESTGKKIY